MKQLDSKYNFKNVENNKYDMWLENDYFRAKNNEKPPFTVVIPPPNVTGILHLGHAWDNTIQDILIRYKHLKGFDTLYLPGMDHAGIATQAVVDARLKSEGISRYDLGREKFIERAFEWKDEYASTIKSQWKSLGLALDYSRERFTLDKEFSRAVNSVFIKLYNDGLLYRRERIINWDIEAKTALSNIEVEYKEVAGKMYTFKYKFVDSDKFLSVSTTRPETMFGDVCIVVNPSDERYKHLIGKDVINPANDEVISIIGDDYVDIEFGSGAMKCTPAHDPNDFEIGERHNLPLVNCMNEDGTMNHIAHKYEGLDRFVARKQLVSDLKANDLVVSIKEHIHQVGHSERTGVIVEPYLSKQWFVNMKPLAKDVLNHQKDENTKIHFYPERFENTLYSWLENIEDWCISRQIWWGHKIPAYYHKDSGDIYVGNNPPSSDYIQDEDVLDTWFSSALWPFATLGWPDNTDDLSRYFPNDTLVTGYDIIFFWVARMAFMSRYLNNTRPFKDVVIHGLIRDAEGKKMSKSLGNGVDPMDVIDAYGIDALRFFLATNSTPGQDIRYIEDKVASASNFINKLWNASRFVIMNLENREIFTPAKEDFSIADKWIIDNFNKVLNNVNTNMDKYEYSLVGNELYHFVWDKYCDWYIELSKTSLNGDDAKKANATAYTLKLMLNNILKMLHPFIPFVTDEIYTHVNNENIYESSWPKSEYNFNTNNKMESLINVIKLVREIRVEYNLKPYVQFPIKLMDYQHQSLDLDNFDTSILSFIGKVDVIDNISGEILERSFDGGIINILLSDVIDYKSEIANTKKEIKRLENEVLRSNKMLSNQGFISKAPQAKIDQEQAKLDNYKKQLQLAQEKLSELKAKMGE